MARFALAGFIHETNTFSPLPTNYQDFDNLGSPIARLLRGKEMFQFLGKRINNAACGFTTQVLSSGDEVVPLLWSAAEPANQVSINAFERIMAMIISGLSDQGPYDGVFLDLHGAMVYEGFNDGETEILRRVGAIVGGIPIVTSLDLHGNISLRSIELASAMIGYRTYPHVDMFETGVRCAKMMQYLFQAKPLYKAFRQVPFLIPLSLQSTDMNPCKRIYPLINEIELNPAIISASILLGFPPADTEHTGPTVITYAETQEDSNVAADSLLQAILDLEEEFSLELFDADLAVRKAMEISQKVDKPVLLADIQDNPGGGGTSDTPWLMEALVGNQALDAAIAIVFDPEAAEAVHAAGEGTKIALNLGGKRMPGQKPFFATFDVVKLFEGEFELTGSVFPGVIVNLGKMAHLQIGGVHVVVSSKRTQALDPTYFRVVGIEPEKMRILVVKSANHYRADFAPIVSAIFPVEAPGSIIDDPSKAVYEHLREGIRLKGLGPEYRCHVKS